ncbi:MAG TPA: DUF4097 family beta strand repeat-containing protein [Longimicrobium sp.]|nr:DUF4097 family beta strand repeat-containing protein [Longimicrobium sp.]
MRYAAVVAASAAAVATFTFARDGRGSESPAAAIQAAAAQTVPARLARQQAAARTQEDFRWSGRLARGQEIEIRGIVGNVSAQPASSDQVEVVGRFTGDDGERLRVEVEQEGDGVVICVIYPGQRRDRDDGDGPCGHGGDWDGDDEDDEIDAGVDFTVRVPQGVKLAAYTVAGDIDATQLRSDVEVATVAGDVRVSTTGSASATSVSGDVEATFGQTREDMDFTTVSGNVIVRLAGDIGAEVEAQTLTGQIESDFPLRTGSMTGHDDEDEDDDHHGGVHVNVQIGQRASGTIGGGGPELTVTTVSGNIRLERAR